MIKLETIHGELKSELNSLKNNYFDNFGKIYYDKEEIIEPLQSVVENEIKELLTEHEEMCTKKEKVFIIIKIMKYLSNCPNFIKENDKFRIVVLQKIKEFENNTIINNMNLEHEFNKYTKIIITNCSA